jgi:hypothetical protein
VHHFPFQIYAYRTSLWAEHLGMVDDRFKDPWSLDCVRLVNEIAGELEKVYCRRTKSITRAPSQVPGKGGG